jgi:hypothetical protein
MSRWVAGLSDGGHVALWLTFAVAMTAIVLVTVHILVWLHFEVRAWRICVGRDARIRARAAELGIDLSHVPAGCEIAEIRTADGEVIQ